MTMNLIRILCLPALALCAAGCVAQKEVTVRSVPSGATVYLNGQQRGITPYTETLKFKPQSAVTSVTVRKEGFKDGTNSITYKPKDQTDYLINLDKVEAVTIELLSFEPAKTDEGVKLTIVRKPTLAYLEVIERSPNVSSVTRVTANEDQAVKIGEPVPSPADNKVLYWEYVEEQGGGRYSNIQMQKVGSTAKTRLTYGKYLDKFPAFTPDGKRVVFSSDRTSANSTLWAVSADTPAGITKLTNTQAEDYSPSVAPDGQLIAFTSNLPRADEPQIWTVPVGSSLMTQLREGEYPQISPDGKHILFVRRDKNSANKVRQLWLMSVDGSRETQLTQNTDYETIDARWSPDGKWIVYASDEGRDSKGEKNFDIWMMAADGSKRTQLTTNGSWDDGPAFDHEGTVVYFRSNRGGAWNIWRFQPMLPN